jgi:hypothetical protein
MNDEQRGMAAFGAQPEGTGPFCRDPALPLAYVPQVLGVRGAWSRAKMASVAAVSIVFTGPWVTALNHQEE